MGEHRCFSNKVTECDDFLEMNTSTQCLYFHLAMNADDRGFISKPRTVMRMCGAGEDDARELIRKKFILAWEDKSVYLIKHWRIHNSIRKDRRKESSYRELLKELYFDENDSYSRNTEHSDRPCYADVWQPSDNQVTTNRQPSDNQATTKCQPNDNQWLPQGKVRQDKLIQDNLREDRGSNSSSHLSYTDEDFNGLNIEEATKSDLRALRKTSKMLYEASIEMYRART